jgi:hypothetical protein
VDELIPAKFTKPTWPAVDPSFAVERRAIGSLRPLLARSGTPARASHTRKALVRSCLLLTGGGGSAFSYSVLPGVDEARTYEYL